MNGLETGFGVILLVSLTIYALMAGADFGAGVWHVMGRGPTKSEQHRLISGAIGPIWEANHVWLILVVTILFTAFPAAYARMSTTLHIPLTLLLVGIILRGSAFAFRHYDVRPDELHPRWDQLFAFSSLISPVLLGINLGAMTAGGFPVNPDNFLEGYVYPWANAFPFAVGLFTLVLFAYLAAVYLILETRNQALQEIFRTRAIGSALMSVLSGAIVLLLAKTGAPRLWGELTGSVWGGAVQIGAGSLTVAAIWLLIIRQYWWVRACAILQVTLTVWAWGIAQFPYLIPPDLTIFNAAAPAITLQLVLVALIVGAILLFPSLFYLFRIFKSRSILGE
jgi:cytochrome bd ubiquinol oxidase subunit II